MGVPESPLLSEDSDPRLVSCSTTANVRGVHGIGHTTASELLHDRVNQMLVNYHRMVFAKRWRSYHIVGVMFRVGVSGVTT